MTITNIKSIKKTGRNWHTRACIVGRRKNKKDWIRRNVVHMYLEKEGENSSRIKYHAQRESVNEWSTAGYI
jgi:hypothetical protein